MLLRSLTTIIPAAFLALLLGASARAQVFERLPEPDWIPSIEVGTEVFDFKGQNSVEGVVTRTSSIRQVFINVGGELASPAFSSLPGRPRIFLGAGVGIPTATENEQLAIGDPGNPFEPETQVAGYLTRLDAAIRRNCYLRPPDNPGGACPQPNVAGFDGQGADIRIDFDDPTWFANLGASFDVPVFEDVLLQVRPAVAYRGERPDIRGRFTSVTLDALIFADPPTADFTILNSATDRKSKTSHHLGPSLELGVVLSRKARPVRATFYLRGSYLWLLGDRRTTVTDGGGLVSYSVHRDRTSFRGGAGIRFSWLGGLGAD